MDNAFLPDSIIDRILKNMRKIQSLKDLHRELESCHFLKNSLLENHTESLYKFIVNHLDKVSPFPIEISHEHERNSSLDPSILGHAAHLSYLEARKQVEATKDSRKRRNRAVKRIHIQDNATNKRKQRKINQISRALLPLDNNISQ